MARQKSETWKSPTPQETEAFLRDMQQFRERAVVYGLKWPTRSGARYTSDAMIRGVDELGLVLTGNDRLFSTGQLESTLRRRRGWDC